MPLERVGRYQIIAEIGRGRMGVVHHASDPRFRRDMAVKVLARELADEEGFWGRFKRTTRTIIVLGHPTIVPVYDFGEHDGCPYLAMRYMAGGSLTGRIAEGLLSPVEAAVILTRVSWALDSAHAQGIIHGNIKPENILFDQDNEAFLSDFGLVPLAESFLKTTDHGIVGTPAYMAPELARPEAFSPLTDIYALGVMLFEMLTGRQPYRAQTPIGVLMAHAEQPIPDICQLQPHLPQSVQAIIARAIAKAPTRRYDAAQQMAEDLRAAVALLEPKEEPDAESPEVDAAPPTVGSIPTTQIATPPARRERPPTLSWSGVKMLWIGFKPLWIGAVAVCAVLSVGVAALAGAFRDGALTAVARPTEATLGQAAMHEGLTEGSPGGAPSEPSSRRTAVSEEEELVGGASVGWLAFQSSRDGDMDIYVMAIPIGEDITSGPATAVSGPTNLTDNAAEDWAPVWSPDGAWIAYQSNQDGNSEIYVIPAPGEDHTDPINLTHDAAYDGFPAWSPDGDQIAFQSDRDGNSEIYIMSVPSEDGDDAEPIRLTENPAYDGLPVWSPDGGYVAFETDRDGNGEIYIVPAPSGPGEGVPDPVNLTGNPANDWKPIWSPDGEWIAFESDRDGNWEIYLMPAPDRPDADPINLTQHAAADQDPAWSSDGTQLAFVSTRDDPAPGSCLPSCIWEVYAVAIPGESGTDGPAPIRLTNNQAVSEAITWSPDGRQIAFGSDHDGNVEIYVVSLNDREQIRLTSSEAYDGWPAWRP